ncbi:MAG TPA: hypothetical protein VFQ88_00820 [Nevskiaceae bacterium]|nr:hypothetical protein [Nevskiaceae bacterium]
MEGRTGAQPDLRVMGVRPDRTASALAQIDQAGGLVHFPQGRGHVYDAELQAAHAAHSRFEHSRDRVEPLWHDDPHWQPQTEADERWLDSDAGRVAVDAEDEIVRVPLIDHSRGHAGTAVKNGMRWLLHGRNAHFFHTQVAPSGHCPTGQALFQRIAAVHNTERPHHQARLQQPNRDHNRNVNPSCAHGPHELRALQGT